MNCIETGYPSLLRPWLRYYPENLGMEIDENNSIYNNFVSVVERKTDALAYIDFKTGRKVTYSELLLEADDFANALQSLGMSGNYKVGMLGFNCCADPVVFLGANKLGVPVVFVSPDGSPADIAENVRHVDILVMQNIFSELEPLINSSNIPVIIQGYTPYLPSEHCLNYEDFISMGIGCDTKAVVPQEDFDALVIFSSGSTGVAKPIVHSNRTISAAIWKMMHSDFPINEGNYLIKAIPSHIGLGSITTMLTGLLSGVTYIQITGLPNPAVDMPKETFELFTHFEEWKKQNGLNDDKGLILFAAPLFAKYYLSRLSEIQDLSMLKGILLGGSKMTKEELDAMDAAFAKRGLQIPVCNGYGQNEMGGAVALNTVHHNKNGSAGYPVIGTMVKIVDRGTFNEVGFNTVGLILEQSDSQFVRYLDMPERTAQAKIKLQDGSEWFNSTDMGYMDEDGFLYITGRTTRVVIKLDHKVSLDVIEEKMKEMPEIDEAAVVANGSGEAVVAFVSCKKAINPETMLADMSAGKTGLSIFEVPDRIELLSVLPRMNNGKIDYMLLADSVNALQ